MCHKSILHCAGRGGLAQHPLPVVLRVSFSSRENHGSPQPLSASHSYVTSVAAWLYFSGNRGKTSLCENYLFCINSSESETQPTLGINRITQNTVV